MKHYLKTLEETMQMWQQALSSSGSFLLRLVLLNVARLPSVRGTAPVGP